MTQLTSDCFDSVKAGQLVFFFLDKAAKRGMSVTKLRLIKWLYLAERESYKEFGEPLVGDRLASLRHGPVPSETLAVIEGKRTSTWGQILYVERKNKHQYVHLATDCVYSTPDDLDRFSDAEIELLESIWAQYGSWSSVKLEGYLHDRSNFPEWDWHDGDRTNWIELETLLKSVGFRDDQIGPMVQKVVSFSYVPPGHEQPK